MNKPKLLHYRNVRLIMERRGRNGERIPFRLRYMTMDGDIIDENNVICTSVDVQHKRRNVKFLNSGCTRTIRDVLILELNDVKVCVR